MKYKTILVVAVVLLVNAMVFGNNVSFGGYSGSFTDPSLWWDPITGTNHVPGSTDTALFYTGAVATVNAGVTHTIGNLYLGEWCQTGLPHNSIQSMVINGDLIALQTANIGCLASGSPTLRGELIINSGGSFSVNEHVFVGKGNNGTIIINGGDLFAGYSLSIGCDPWSSGTGVGMIYLNGGSITTDNLYYENDASKIVISDGVVRLNKYNLAAITSGHIVAAEGKTLQYTTWAAPGDQIGIEITVIPEPATMVLLGLGGILLARRRKS